MMDPLAEKYYNISPYAYVANNPLRYINPDGREIVISGVLNKEALAQIQAWAGNTITLSINDQGNVAYTSNADTELSGEAKFLAGMIDSKIITVDLWTTDTYETPSKNLFVGGAFMGNTITRGDNVRPSVVAKQEVNPNVLGSADAHTNTPGKMMMHEVTEAYMGAVVSLVLDTNAKPATGSEITRPLSIYNQAHQRATPQTPVYLNFYDRNGNWLKNSDHAVRME